VTITRWRLGKNTSLVRRAPMKLPPQRLLEGLKRYA